ncbi:MAG: hypothetical protein Q8K58_05310 [Acidimicrobiales bacterium]|nr:hypothetical protein [Acidimicrobiales bacterium]
MSDHDDLRPEPEADHDDVPVDRVSAAPEDESPAAGVLDPDLDDPPEPAEPG